ncbi:MAG TPA: GNAT family N-acetyltransferase [Stenotrophobium sp.]|nr:GNAT family N-acetyltransferase [Stenotrophobium sp.]
MSAATPIRRARPADAAAILELERHFPSDRMSARAVRDFLRSPRATVWVAQVEAGLVAGNLILLTRARSRAARIYSVVVDPVARGRGIAQRLLRAAEATARKRGIAAITLEVRADNAAARALYRKHGYAEIRTLPVFYDDGADGVKLRKTLRP